MEQIKDTKLFVSKFGDRVNFLIQLQGNHNYDEGIIKDYKRMYNHELIWGGKGKVRHSEKSTEDTNNQGEMEACLQPSYREPSKR